MDTDKALAKYALTHTGVQATRWAKMNGISCTKIPSSAISRAAYEGDVESFTALVTAGVKVDFEDAIDNARDGKAPATMLSLLASLKQVSRGSDQMIVHVAIPTGARNPTCIVAKLPVGTAFDPREHLDWNLFDTKPNCSLALNRVDLLHIQAIDGDFETKLDDPLTMDTTVSPGERDLYGPEITNILQERPTGRKNDVCCRYEDNRWTLKVNNVFEPRFHFWLRTADLLISREMANL